MERIEVYIPAVIVAKFEYTVFPLTGAGDFRLKSIMSLKEAADKFGGNGWTSGNIDGVALRHLCLHVGVHRHKNGFLPVFDYRFDINHRNHPNKSFIRNFHINLESPMCLSDFEEYVNLAPAAQQMALIESVLEYTTIGGEFHEMLHDTYQEIVNQNNIELASALF